MLSTHACWRADVRGRLGLLAITVMRIPHRDAAALAHAAPDQITAWALERFATWRISVTTAFGMEGCALVDMVARTGHPLRITYLDTHFLFPETLALRDRMIRRYPQLTFVNAGTELTPEAQEATYGPRLWVRDPDTCCRLRKVEPMRRLLSASDVWITAIRRDQSSDRAHTRIVDWDWRYDLLKVSPLASWSRAEVWDYIRANDVPYNDLHERGYPSIGCTHCTVPVPGATPESYSRAGRWQGTDRTECGIHSLGERSEP
jgi:phosphoadenosine phosphosulfate reductase